MQEPDEGAVHKVNGIYRVVDPPNKLVYTWQWEGDPAETQVTLEFLSRGTGTELVLTHEGFADGDSRAPRAGVDFHPRAPRRTTPCRALARVGWS